MIKKLLLPLILSFALLCSCGQTNDSWQEQYDLGVKYLSEGNYEEAILAFEAAISIDPKRAEAYAGMAKAYMAMNNHDQAVESLQRGMEAVGESEILSNTWTELGLAPLTNNKGEADPQENSSTGEVSFLEITPEEITKLLPSLTQPESTRTEREQQENGFYEISEYDTNDFLIRTVTYTQDETEIGRIEYYRDRDNFTLMVNYYSPDGITYPGGFQYRVYTQHLILDYSDLSAWRNEPDTTVTTYHYSGPQVTLTQRATTAEYDCNSTIVYTMSSPDHEIELWEFSTDAANSSYEYLIICESGPELPNGIFFAFHGDGTPYPEFDLSQYTS